MTSAGAANGSPHPLGKNLLPPDLIAGGEAGFLPVVLHLLDLLPLACRIVDADRRVVWQTPALQNLLTLNGDLCCESLGCQHHAADCPSLRTIQSGRAQRANRWLGRLYVSVETVPLTAAIDGRDASFEFFTDITIEKRLETAYIQQQELLEATNKAMIEINHHLEAAQQELEVKNQSLEQANDQLRSLDRLKDEFISIVSHELKAPLTSIKGSVDLIQLFERDKLSPKGSELLAICRRSTDRLNGMVKDLLDVARIESGRLSLEFVRFPLHSVIVECFETSRTLAEQKSLRLDNGVPEELEIEADYGRLLQVLINLVNNAIKFTDQGGITVDALAEPAVVTITVTDTGIGIPEDAQATIFEKFGQVGSTLHRNTNGTGLGLSIVRGIVREHGGEIGVQSVPGHGSCFTFTIPQPPGKVRAYAASPLD
ncbi:MAG TPA: HAMP domain-containing sensor histidine kinase [bacterium]|jgi:signal transduction histidine kinase